MKVSLYWWCRFVVAAAVALGWFGVDVYVGFWV
jgi:hypothetical protein